MDGLRILVVDDEREIRELLAEALAGRGYQVAVAGNADEALEALGISWRTLYRRLAEYHLE